MEHTLWVFEIKKDGQYHFTKFVDGREVITHHPMDKAAASVFAVSIIQGFQPPALFAEVDGE